MPIFDDAALQQQIALVQEAQTGKPKQQGIGAAPYSVMAGGQFADLLTTLIAMQHGATEANPVMAGLGPVGMTAAKGAGTVAIALLMRELAKRGHPKIAKAMGYGSGAATGAIAVHNASHW